MPHGDFSSEVKQLRSELGELGSYGSAYVLGDALNGLQWHVFVADAGALDALPPPPVYTLEICMTHLCPVKVQTSLCGPETKSGFLHQERINQGVIVWHMHALLKYSVLGWVYGLSMGCIDQLFMRFCSFLEC